MADCGDGGLDPGEACDDGNLDEFDDCTTSCTANDHGIGAPCACVDGCDDFDFSAGAIVGCGGVAAPPDGAAVPACIRAVEIPVFGYRVYAAGGYCSLYATGCAGAGCAVVPVVGDVDEFTCPEGAVPRTIVVDTGLVVVTTKHCAVPCETQADCRWNATEETRPDGGRICGQWRCLYDPETVSFACVDPRNG
jgi:cysteine-rich repeat protein